MTENLPNPKLLPVLGRYAIYSTTVLGGVNESIDLESAEPTKGGFFIKDGNYVLPIPEKELGNSLNGRIFRLLRENERAKVVDFKRRTITEYSPLDKYALIECDSKADMVRIFEEMEQRQSVEGATIK